MLAQAPVQPGLDEGVDVSIEHRLGVLADGLRQGARVGARTLEAVGELAVDVDVHGVEDALLLALDEPPTALFASNDLLAVDVLETAEELGVSRIEQLSWKDILDTYTYTECGRCEINCPAYLTGKELSPKKIMHDMRRAIEHEIAKTQTPLFVWDALRPAKEANGNGASHNGEVHDLNLIDAVGFNRVRGLPLASEEISEAINQLLGSK